MKRIITLSLAAVISLSAGDWDVDYVQKITSGASYDTPGGGKFRDFGGYSLKSENINDSGQMFAYKRPKMRGGCGGIDIDFGGFGFSGDVLVQKVKKVVAAAPGFAFQYAMKTFAPKVSATLEWIDSVMTALNNLDLDSCAVAEALVNKAGDLMTGANPQQDSGVPSSGNGDSYSASQKHLQKQVENSTWDSIVNAGTSFQNFDLNAALLGTIGQIGEGWKGTNTFLDYVASRNQTSFSNLANVGGQGADVAKGVLLAQALIGDIGVSKEAGGTVTPTFAPPTLNVYELFIDGGEVAIVKPKFGGGNYTPTETVLTIKGINANNSFRDPFLTTMTTCLTELDTFLANTAAGATISPATLATYSKWFSGTNIYRFKKAGLLTDVDNKALSEVIYTERKKVALKTVITAISKNFSKNSEGDLTHDVTKEKSLMGERIKMALKDIDSNTSPKHKEIKDKLDKAKDNFAKVKAEKYQEKMGRLGKFTKIK